MAKEAFTGKTFDDPVMNRLFDAVLASKIFKAENRLYEKLDQETARTEFALKGEMKEIRRACGMFLEKTGFVLTIPIVPDMVAGAFKSGIARMNPVVVCAFFEEAGGGMVKVTLASYAKEGMFYQKTAPMAVEQMQKAVTNAWEKHMEKQRIKKG